MLLRALLPVHETCLCLQRASISVPVSAYFPVLGLTPTTAAALGRSAGASASVLSPSSPGATLALYLAPAHYLHAPTRRNSPTLIIRRRPL